MFRQLLLVLVALWSHTVVQAQDEVMFDPPTLGFDDSQVTLTAKYDLKGDSAKIVTWISPKGSSMLIWNKETAENLPRPSFEGKLLNYDKFDAMDTTHSLTLKGDWCDSTGIYDCVVQHDTSEVKSTTARGTLLARKHIRMEVDMKPFEKDVEVSQLTGSVTCTAAWNTIDLRGKLTDSKDTVDATVADSTPSPCTIKAQAMMDYDFTGAEQEAKTFDCKMVFGGEEVSVTRTLTYKADDGGDGGNTDDGNTDGGNTDNGNTDGGNTDGGNTDGGNTDGGNTDDGNADGGNPGDKNKSESKAAGHNSLNVLLVLVPVVSVILAAL